MTAGPDGGDPGAFAARYGPWAAVLGAGQGIGRAFARRLAARGLHLLLVDLRQDLLDAARAEVEAAADVEVRTAALDLGGPRAGEALAEALAGADAGLGVVTAARSRVGSFLAAPLADLRADLRVNCDGALVAAHVMGRRLRARGRGGLVLLSSLAGLQGTGWVAGYAAAKAFDRVLAEALWWELAPHGVDVLALVAGSTDTPGFRAQGPRVEDPAGLQTPDAVAEEGLVHLGAGPVHVCGEANRRIAGALAGLPVDERIRVMSEGTRRLYPDADPD